MKFLKTTFAIFIVMLIACAPLMQAQTKTHNFKVVEGQNAINIRLDATHIDSAGVIWSQAIDITKYAGNSFSTYPFDYSARPVKTTGTDSLTTRYELWTCQLDPAVNANWKVRDTVATINVATATATPPVTTGTAALANLNNPTRPIWMKIKILNLDVGKGHTINFGFGRVKF